MNGQPDKDKAADEVLNASCPFLKSDESERVKGQLSYIVQYMKEERAFENIKIMPYVFFHFRVPRGTFPQTYYVVLLNSPNKCLDRQRRITFWKFYFSLCHCILVGIKEGMQRLHTLFNVSILSFVGDDIVWPSLLRVIALQGLLRLGVRGLDNGHQVFHLLHLG